MGKHAKFSERFRVDDGSKFQLADFDPGDTAGIESKEAAAARLQKGIARLAELQDKLYAQDRWSVLLVFQALDAAGKDGTIKHVMSGVNPAGCQIVSFKAPNDDELDHDWMWRCWRAFPERGKIGIFNRSWYEEVLVVRVHPELLGQQKLPAGLVTKKIWDERLEDIVAFERHLARNGCCLLKFFLHVSEQEQKQRFLERIAEPEKNWKFSAADVRERRHWDAYHTAYEQAIGATAAPHAPWYVVPADHKWFTRLVVAEAIVAALEGLKLEYPRVGEAERGELEDARAELESGAQE